MTAVPHGKRGYALLDRGSGKLIAGPFATRREADSANRRHNDVGVVRLVVLNG